MLFQIIGVLHINSLMNVSYQNSPQVNGYCILLSVTLVICEIICGLNSSLHVDSSVWLLRSSWVHALARNVLVREGARSRIMLNRHFQTHRSYYRANILLVTIPSLSVLIHEWMSHVSHGSKVQCLQSLQSAMGTSCNGNRTCAPWTSHTCHTAQPSG